MCFLERQDFKKIIWVQENLCIHNEECQRIWDSHLTFWKEKNPAKV